MAWHKRVFQRLLRSQSRRNVKNNLVEAIANAKGEGNASCTKDGVKRIKIVVSKHELEKLLQLVNDSKTDVVGYQSFVSAEQRLKHMQRKNIVRKKVVKGRQTSWFPTLHSIPEES